jgi:hypothetical protein
MRSPVVGWLMNNEVERMSKDPVMDTFDALSLSIVGWFGILINTSVSVACL